MDGHLRVIGDQRHLDAGGALVLGVGMIVLGVLVDRDRSARTTRRRRVA
jgi:hypothetical protein